MHRSPAVKSILPTAPQACRCGAASALLDRIGSLAVRELRGAGADGRGRSLGAGLSLAAAAQPTAWHHEPARFTHTLLALTHFSVGKPRTPNFSPRLRCASASTLAISTRPRSLGSLAIASPSFWYSGTRRLQWPHPARQEYAKQSGRRGFGMTQAATGCSPASADCGQSACSQAV